MIRLARAARRLLSPFALRQRDDLTVLFHNVSSKHRHRFKRLSSARHSSFKQSSSTSWFTSTATSFVISLTFKPIRDLSLLSVKP